MIRLLLLARLVAVLLVPVVGRETERIRALEKVAFVFVVVGAMLFLAVSQATTAIVNLLGVGRGTDLIVYLLVIVTMHLAASVYVEVRRLADRDARIVQELAFGSDRLARLESAPGREWPGSPEAPG